MTPEENNDIHSLFFKECREAAKRASDIADQTLTEQHNKEREQRRYKKILADVEKEGLILFKNGVFYENPTFGPMEWHFYYNIAQSNITYAVLEEWR